MSTQASHAPPDHSRWHVLSAGFLCYGFDAMDFMVLALALPAISQEWHLTYSQAGLLGTAGMLGVGISGIVLGWFADNFGRRRALILSVCTFALFTALISLARDRFDVMALRFCAGIGLGGVWGVVATLIHESWSPRYRARAIAVVLSAWPVGLSIAALLTRLIVPHAGWRMLFACGGAAFVAALYVWLWVPESKRWREQRELTRDSAPASAVQIREIFSPQLRRSTVLGTLAAACALTAYWGSNTWLPMYLERERGLDTAHMANVIVMLNAGMFVGYQLFGFIADRYGRRRALLCCFAGASVLLPLYAAIRDHTLLFWMGPVVALCFAYAGPFGAYFPELYPTRVRSLGTGFCFNVGRGLAAFAPYVLGQMATQLGLSLCIALSALGYLAAGIVMCFLPERA
jgi:predicted MFS family arabinose efflux permease